MCSIPVDWVGLFCYACRCRRYLGGVMPRVALTISGFIFLLIAVVHIARLVYDFEFRIGFEIPPWLNVVGSVVALGMALVMFKAAAMSKREG